MIVSQSKTEDIRIRMNMLEVMEIALRHGLIDDAKSIGESSVKMQEKINTKDYTREDAWLMKEKELRV